MVHYSEVLKQFDITVSDEDEIKRVGASLLQFRERFVSDLMVFVQKNARITETMRREVENNYRDQLINWYNNLVAGKLDNSLTTFIMSFNINETPKNHFDDEAIASMFSFIRRWFQEKVYGMSETEWEYGAALRAYSKIIDASMYIVMNIYIRNKCGGQSESKLKSTVLHFSEKFSLVTHVTLLIFLICMTVGGIVHFLYNTVDLMKVSPDRLFVTALGSLLVLWVLVELINSEIQMLRGDKFRISIFVGVVLIAFIRDLLIMTLKHDSNLQPTMLLIGGVFVLGITYWLLARSEKGRD